MPRMLGISAPPGLIDDVIVPPEANGVRLISMGFFAREDQAVIWRGPMLHKALEQFLTDVYWGELDYLVVDMPPGTGDISLSIAQFLPRAEVLVVTTPQPAAQRVAVRAAAMAEKVDLQVIGVVENMSWFTGDDGKRYELFGSGGGEELAGELGVPLLARIPLVPALREGGDVGRPIVVVDPDGEVSQVFRDARRAHRHRPRAEADLQPAAQDQLRRGEAQFVEERSPERGVELVGRVEREAGRDAAQRSRSSRATVGTSPTAANVRTMSSSIRSPISTHLPSFERRVSSGCRSPHPWWSSTPRYAGVDA